MAKNPRISTLKAIKNKMVKTHQDTGMGSGDAVLPLTALRGRYSPVVDVGQPHPDLLLAELPVTLQRLVFLQHVLQALLVRHQVLVAAAA